MKFWEDLLYFLAFSADVCLCPKSVIITTLSMDHEILITLSYTNIMQIHEIVFEIIMQLHS